MVKGEAAEGIFLCGVVPDDAGWCRMVLLSVDIAWCVVVRVSSCCTSGSGGGPGWLVRCEGGLRLGVSVVWNGKGGAEVLGGAQRYGVERYGCVF